MSALQDLLSGVRAHEESGDVQRGRFSASLNPIQTQKAESLLQRIGSGFVNGSGADFKAPSHEAFLLGLLELAAKGLPEVDGVTPAVDGFVKQMLFPVKTVREAGETGGRKKGAKRRAKKGGE